MKRPSAWENVFFGATGDIRLTGANPFSWNAGVVSILVETDVRRPRGVVYALAVIREGGEVRVLVDARSVGADVARHRVRLTTDGSDPGAGQPLVEDLVTAQGRVRAVLTVGGRPVVTADTDAPRFRTAGSVALEPEPGP